jgi:hypothetical protein
LGQRINDIIGVAANVVSDVAAAGVVVVLVWLRDFIFSGIVRFWHWTEGSVRQRTHILVWTDDHRSSSQKICRALKTHDNGSHIYRPLERPRSLFLFPTSAKRVGAIILINSDVSKLADKPSVQANIESRLERYVSKGGTLIGTHDIIYRRVRCIKLQRMFGCQTTKFYPCRPGKVHYRLSPEAVKHPLRAGLAEEFDLDDGEVVWGDWAPDAQVIYSTPETTPKPLVVAREHGDGKLVWLNSGDKTEWLCASLALPEEAFVHLLMNSIRWA